MNRSARTDSIFRWLMAAGGFGVLAIILLIVSGFGLFLLCAIISAGCSYQVQRGLKAKR